MVSLGLLISRTHGRFRVNARLIRLNGFLAGGRDFENVKWTEWVQDSRMKDLCDDGDEH